MTQMSAFEVLGPIMIGPSSSHTAGALRCAQTALALCAGEPASVTFTLWNSFAHTYRGHGTDRALRSCSPLCCAPFFGKTYSIIRPMLRQRRPAFATEDGPFPIGRV